MTEIFRQFLISKDLKNFENFDYFYNIFAKKMDSILLKDFYTYDKRKKKYIFKKRNFEKVIDDVLEDYYNENQSLNITNLKDKFQPIFQSPLVRKMSGYLFADLNQKNLYKINQAIKIQKNYTIEIPLSIKKIELQNFIQKFVDIKYLAPEQTLQEQIHTPFKIFQRQQKIVQNSFFKNQFFEIRENFNQYSWSILFLFSCGWVFINVFKNIYKKYAKEIVESCIDFIQRAGLIDDVQWIKEELGMAPIDKGYRGIRHHGKKLKNIIGINRKHIIIEVSEMVWFLKTKKLIQLTSLDPLAQILLFFQQNFKIKIENSQKKELTTKIIVIEPEPFIPLNWRKKQDTMPLQPLDISRFSKNLELHRILQEKAKMAQKFESILDKLKFKQNQQYLKPKGFLFAGPPGTGKTLLVQAIAGETGVPVVTQSGGLLQNPRLRGRGAKTLHKLFIRAREIAPCIIFIDEIDGIGARRQFLPLNVDIHGNYDPVELLESESLKIPPSNFQLKLQRRPEFFDDHDPLWEEPEFTQDVQVTKIPIDVLQDMLSSREARNEQLSILTQLLIEMDGLHLLESIVVIGATNRLEILDPALMRPGRFQRILRFNLPDYTARVNLLKLYTQTSKIGIENISWDYFAKRTYGLSSADIASIVFASELTAVQNAQKHNIKTLERGIDLITSFPSDPVLFRLKKIFVFLNFATYSFLKRNHFYLTVQRKEFINFKLNISNIVLHEISTVLRNSYYGIGKILTMFCLNLAYESSAYITLWERPKNFRFFFFTKDFNEFERKLLPRKEIEKRFASFLGGKVAESLYLFLPLHKFVHEIYFQFDYTFISLNNSLEQSNFGLDSEIRMAQNLLKLMVDKWYFYFERVATEKFHPILEDVNIWEYVTSERDMLFGRAFADEMIINLDMRNRLSKNEQKHSYQAWWMKKVATRLNYRERSVLQWSRIYLSDPDNSEQNIEWVAPDAYFHTTPRIPPFCMTWAHFLENGRFAVSNMLLVSAFNQIFVTLRPFSEFMDFLADYILRHEYLRETEFQSKTIQFFTSYLQETHSND